MVQCHLVRHQLDKFPLQMPSVTIYLYATVPFDLDGAYNAVKPILDGLKKDYAGIIEDDSPKFINLEVKQIKVVHRKDEHVEINIV